MINMADITKAVHELIVENLPGYTVVRNEKRNRDPNVAAKNKGWIGIYKDNVTYEAHTTGARPWLATPRVRIEIQVASMKSTGSDVEDRLEEAVQEIMNLLTGHKTLNDTVGTTMGYELVYEINEDVDMYHYAAIITINTEVRQ